MVGKVKMDCKDECCGRLMALSRRHSSAMPLPFCARSRAVLLLLIFLLAAPLASAELGSALKTNFGSVSPAFPWLGSDRPLPSYAVSQPEPGSTLTQIRWPMCFGKHSAMLGR